MGTAPVQAVMIVLASVDRSGQLFGDVAPWLLILLVVTIVGGVVVFMARRMLQGNASSGKDGFTLQDLRDLHAAGDLSDEEFERARAAMIERIKAAQPPNPADSSPGNREPGAH